MSTWVLGTNYTPPPEGLHRAVCVDVIDLGVVETQFSRKPRVRAVFEIDTLTEDGRHHITSKTYTKSLNQKSSLYKDLRSWRGRPLLQEETKKFDLDRLIGVPCQVIINHVERDDTTYGNIITIMPAERAKVYEASGQYVRNGNGGNGPTNPNATNEQKAIADYDDSDMGEDNAPF
jgi:hypothetical protein